MADPPQKDPNILIEELRARHQDPRAYVDALLHRFDSAQAVGIRNLGPLAQEALRVSREIGYERGEAVGLLAVGFVHFLWQRNQEAFPLLIEARSKLEPLDEVVALGRCCTGLAGLHNSMANYQQALEFGHEALKSLENLESGEWRGWPNYMLGDSYRGVGDLERARAHYGEAYDIFSAADVEAGMARALIGLGGVCRDQSDFEASEAHFVEARKLAEKRSDPFQTARALSELALVRQLTGDVDVALDLFEQSLNIRRANGGGLFLATCLIDVGNLLIKLDRLAEAVESLSEALDISIEHDHKPRVFAAHLGLSEAYASKGDLEKALFHHKEFQRIKEEVMSADLATRLRNLEISLEAAAAQKEAELVKEYNAELQLKNADLARLLQELRDAQEMLIQSEKMASLGQLTAGIAHEIRNPLNFVNNFSAITRELAEELTLEIKQHSDDSVSSIESEILELARDISANAERILEHGRRAGQIVNSMLVHSRRSGGKKTDVNVNELVSTSVDLAHHGFLATCGDLEVVIEQRLAEDAGMFSIIEDEVARVLTNILNNALFAVREHGETSGEGFIPRILVETVRRNGTVEVTISDNGPGIDDERKNKVFEPFYTTKPTGSGTGLGLSQSYEIITERHGGTLKIRDTDGGGATFVVTLPG